MPELPEVETIAQDLAKAGLAGKRIADVEVHWPRTVAHPSPADLRKRLIGQVIKSIERRGKYLKIALSSGECLLIHLRMTGRLLIARAPTEQLPHERVTLIFDDGDELKFIDTRKFGRWLLAEDPEEVLGKLGPEPLGPEFTVRYLEQLCRKSQQLKPMLLDQSCVAGLGNIYVDEALWRAELHPQKKADTLSKEQITKLHVSIQQVLQRGLKASGTTLGKGLTNYYRLDGSRGSHQEHLDAFRRTGKPCPRCGTPIRRLVVGQRSTHICPKCQAYP
ncbi:MAG: bifunctional DNA-formamidopyrimidine glycosylase/DNA-(apurinic or apyrimidinic site) lyase [Parachlamydia sp.]|nr:bifunctional DNA-formamidopyrimidine glycosylase/DNA-(apurinic or apyrimidinic site) lyase [Parachlamydia sp.]